MDQDLSNKRKHSDDSEEEKISEEEDPEMVGPIAPYLAFREWRNSHSPQRYPFQLQHHRGEWKHTEFYAFANYLAFKAEYFDKARPFCFEMVVDRCMLFFDVEYYDNDVTPEDFIASFIQALTEYFATLTSTPLNPDFVISTAHGYDMSKQHDKYSFHIIIRRIGYFPNANVVKAFVLGFKEFIETSSPSKPYYFHLSQRKCFHDKEKVTPTKICVPIDANPYIGSHTNLRLLYSAKPDDPDRKVIKLTDHPDECFVISYVGEEPLCALDCVTEWVDATDEENPAKKKKKKTNKKSRQEEKSPAAPSSSSPVDIPPDLMAVLRTAIIQRDPAYSISKTDRSEDGNYYYINLKKNKASRQCPFHGARHKSNQTSFIYHIPSQQLNLKCFDGDCSGKLLPIPLPRLEEEKKEENEESISSSSSSNSSSSSPPSPPPPPPPPPPSSSSSSSSSSSPPPPPPPPNPIFAQLRANIFRADVPVYIDHWPVLEGHMSPQIFLIQTVAAIFNGGKMIYVTKSRLKNKYQGIQFNIVASTDLENTLKKYFAGPVRPTKKRLTLFHILCEIRKDITYTNMDFLPYNHLGATFLPVPHDVFNLYTGMAVRYDPNFVVMPERIEPLLELIRTVWCSGDHCVDGYVIHWLAHLIQKPFTKAAVAILLYSEKQGVGKNLVLDFFREFILRHALCVNLSSLEQFNGLLAQKLLVTSDELGCHISDYKAADIIKNLITASTLRVERKGLDATEIQDFMRLLFTTNNEKALFIQASDRRTLLLQCIRNADLDHVALTALYNQYLSGAGGVLTGQHLYHYLCRLDLTGFDPRNDLPTTRYKLFLILEGLNSSYKYMLDQYRKPASAIFERPLGAEDLFHHYKAWNKDYNKNYGELTKDAFCKDLHKWGIVNDRNLRTYTITPLQIK